MFEGKFEEEEPRAGREVRKTAEEILEIKGSQILTIVSSPAFLKACQEAGDYVYTTGHETHFSVFLSLQNPSDFEVSSVTHGGPDSVNPDDLPIQRRFYKSGKIPIQVIDLHFHTEAEEGILIIPSGAHDGEGDLPRILIPEPVYDFERKIKYTVQPIMIIGRIKTNGDMDFLMLQKKRKGLIIEEEFKILADSFDSAKKQEEILQALADVGFYASFFSISAEGEISWQDKIKIASFSLKVHKEKPEDEDDLAIISLKFLEEEPQSENDLEKSENIIGYSPEKSLIQDERCYLRKVFYSVMRVPNSEVFNDLCSAVARAKKISNGGFSVRELQTRGDITIFMHIMDDFGSERFSISWETLKQRIEEFRKTIKQKFRESERRDLLDRLKEELSVYEPQFRNREIVGLVYLGSDFLITKSEKSFYFYFLVASNEDIDLRLEKVSEEMLDDWEEKLTITPGIINFEDLMRRLELAETRQWDQINELGGYELNDFIVDIFTIMTFEIIDLEGANGDRLRQKIENLREQIIEMARDNIFLRAILTVPFIPLKPK